MISQTTVIDPLFEGPSQLQLASNAALDMTSRAFAAESARSQVQNSIISHSILRRSFFLVLVLLAALPATMLWGQAFNAGAIGGTVTTPKGLTLSDVSVVATELATNLTYSAVSTNRGQYLIPQIKSGVYKVTFSAKGFKMATADRVVIQLDLTDRLDKTMVVSAPSDTVLATAGDNTLNYSSPEISTKLNPKQASKSPRVKQTTFDAVHWNGKSLIIDGHPALFNAEGELLPRVPLGQLIDREMAWYAKCPWQNGYPRFVTMTFMTAKYGATGRRDIIPAMQNGMGILSYLEYYHWKHEKDPESLRIAKAMGDFLIRDMLTPPGGAYPRFTRSTGWQGTLPLPPDSGSQKDHPYEIEPDKGGIAGYALMRLYRETGDKRYLDQALQNARDLVRNMRPGDATHSPWPFRVDYRTGKARGQISSDMSFILRLFDQLIAAGYPEFTAPRAQLMAWIKTYQLPSLQHGGKLWVQFFEDYEFKWNRNSWAPLNLARYFVEKRNAADSNWKADAHALIEFAVTNFCTVRWGLVLCGEQDDDKSPWGGAFSTFGGVLAEYTARTGDQEYRRMAHQILVLGSYAIEDNGAPRASILKSIPGGWQEDAHTDKIHNYIDAFEAFPKWAK